MAERVVTPIPTERCRPPVNVSDGKCEARTIRLEWHWAGSAGRAGQEGTGTPGLPWRPALKPVDTAWAHRS